MRVGSALQEKRIAAFQEVAIRKCPMKLRSFFFWGGEFGVLKFGVLKVGVLGFRCLGFRALWFGVFGISNFGFGVLVWGLGFRVWRGFLEKVALGLSVLGVRG